MVPASYYMPPERAQCIAAAAEYYHRPTDRLTVEGLEMLVTAVVRTEGGTTGQIHQNKPDKNGRATYDIGLMQINSSNLARLAKMGITENMILNYECANIYVGTFILQEGIASTPDLWQGIGRYNSATPYYNARYQALVWKQLNNLWAVR